tara:strand:+ start:1516 stop:1842 length:327 start_codon:yes stop_codon:yes gene_type:complete
MKLSKDYIRKLIREELGSLSEVVPPAPDEKAAQPVDKTSVLGAGGAINPAKTALAKAIKHTGIVALQGLAAGKPVEKLAVIEVLLTQIAGLDPALLKANKILLQKLAK